MKYKYECEWQFNNTFYIYKDPSFGIEPYFQSLINDLNCIKDLHADLCKESFFEQTNSFLLV